MIGFLFESLFQEEPIHDNLMNLLSSVSTADISKISIWKYHIYQVLFAVSVQFNLIFNLVYTKILVVPSKRDKVSIRFRSVGSDQQEKLSHLYTATVG